MDYAEVFSTKEHCCYYGSGVVNGTALPYDRVFSTPNVPWGNGVDTLSTAPVGHSLQIGGSSVSFFTQNGFADESPSGELVRGAPYYSALANSIEFSPVKNVSVSEGEVFKLGTFSVTNGSWFAATSGADGITRIGFSITTKSEDSLVDGHFFLGFLSYESVFGSAPDHYWIENAPELGFFTVEDYPGQNVGTVDLYGHIGSLHLNYFANPTGGAAIPSSVPTSGTLSLAGTGLLLLLSRRRGSVRSAS